MVKCLSTSHSTVYIKRIFDFSVADLCCRGGADPDESCVMVTSTFKCLESIAYRCWDELSPQSYIQSIMSAHYVVVGSKWTAVKVGDGSRGLNPNPLSLK